MGNRTFLYTADRLPDPANGNDEPSLCESVAEGNNCLPPLWLALLSAAQPGPAQDFQQIFLPSVAGGIYAPRDLGEDRLFRLLECIASHPRLDDAGQFRLKTNALKAYLATLDGTVYSADLNEWFYLTEPFDDSVDPMDTFVARCATRWERAEVAMASRDYGALEELFEFDARDAANGLGFRCWNHDYFSGHKRDKASETFEAFCLAAPDSDDTASDGGDTWLGHGLFSVEQGGKVGLRRESAEGDLLLPAIYDDICAFEDGMAVAPLVLNELWGLYDSSGKVVLEPSIEEIFAFNEGVAVARIGALFGFVDRRGHWLVMPRYDDVADFSCGMALVERDGLNGYVNLLGAEAIAPQFLDGSDSFTESGCAKVETGTGFGVVDRQGNLVIAPHYRDIDWLDDLQAWSASTAGDDKDVYFANGKKWFTGAFDAIDCVIDQGDALIERGQLWGSVQRNGQPGLPCIYSNIAVVLEAQDGLAGATPLIYEVTSGGTPERCGACAANGKVLVPIQFASVDPITFVPYEEGESGNFVPHPAHPLLLEAPGTGGTGVWSLALARQVLDCKYDAVYACRVGEQIFLLALDQRHGWTIALDDGTLLTARPYRWLRDASLTGSDDYHPFLIGADLVSMWSEGKPIAGWYGNQPRRLYSDGREQSTLDYHLALVHDPDGTPIVPMDSLVQDLPRPAKTGRPVSHAIAGVCNPDACHALGDMYASADGVPEDRVKACRWYATAAAAGHPEARYWYGFYLMNGLGCTPDLDAARALFEGLGPEHRRALNCLGCIHERKGDLRRARAMMFAAAAGERNGYATAQSNAGMYCRLGKGGPVDRHMALQYYEWADDERQYQGQPGDPDAAGCAGDICCELALEANAAGRADDQQRMLHRALYFYKKMLSYGLLEALLPLARCNLGHFGGPKEIDAARVYLREALGIAEFAVEARQLWDTHQLGR